MATAHDNGNRAVWGILALVLALYAGVTLSRSLRGPSTAPDYFDTQLSLEGAMQRAGDEGRVVLAVATADWCAPCSSYKQNALRDERIASWASDNAIPIMIDIDARPEEAAALGVSSIPRTVVIRDGRAVAAVEGALPANMLLEFLQDASKQ